MRIKFLFLVLVASLIILPREVIAQWIQSNGLYGVGFVDCFTEIGENLFAGTTDSGMFLSTDSGETWTSVNGTSNSAITSFAQGITENSANFFAGTAGGVFLSADSG